MGFPVAVSSTIRTPGFYLLLNLLAATTSPGAAPRRCLVIATKSTSGDMTNDTELRQSIAGANAAGTALGPGMPGHLALKRIFQRNPTAQVDLVCPSSPAGVKASGTITFVAPSPVATTRTVSIDICGRVTELDWSPAETITSIAARAVVAVNAKSDDIPVVLTSLAGVVNVEAKDPGTWGNDVTYSVTVSGGGPSSATATAAGPRLTGGTLVADPTDVLELVELQEYDFLVVASAGNTDTNGASATTNVALALVHVHDLNHGLNAKLQQVIVGNTGAISAAKTGTAYHNSPELEVVYGSNFRSLPAELAGAEVAERMALEADNPVINRCNTTFGSTLYGPADLVDGALTGAEIEDGLTHGLSVLTFTASGAPRMSRPITSHFKDDNGNPDDRAYDVGQVSGAYAFLRDLRTTVPQEFSGANIQGDVTGTDEPPPPGTVETRDVLAYVISRAQFWIKEGVLHRGRIREAIANGEFVVRVNPSDDSQVDILVPERTVPPLAKIGLVMNAV